MANSSCVCTRQQGPLNDRINYGYETSSKLGHYYENVVDHSLNHLRVKRDFRKDLRVRDPVMRDLNKTTNARVYDVKYWDDRKPDQYRMKRFSLASKTDLKFLHETYMKNPVIPMKFSISTTADHYSPPEKDRTPLSSPWQSPIEKSTCRVRALGRDEFPSVPTNSPSMAKHLDIFVGTSQLAHPRFTEDRQNGVARKDIGTFYDMNGTPKCRGFGPRKTMPIGSYFHRDKTEPDRIRISSVCRVPYLGKSSEYNARFRPPGSEMGSNGYNDRRIRFPTIFPTTPFDILSTPAMYCTENCHIGTGWPLRASIQLGTVKETF